MEFIELICCNCCNLIYLLVYCLLFTLTYLNPTTTGGGGPAPLRCDLTGENSESKLGDFSGLCFANILGEMMVPMMSSGKYSDLSHFFAQQQLQGAGHIDPPPSIINVQKALWW